jgi:small nuclear ribonucleoprotein (snRNP)-like protein
MSKFFETADKFRGQKVAVICARYQYRGILSSVDEDHLVLANATAIETSGPCSAAAPQTEDNIGGAVVIKTDAIEILYQPNWVHAPLPGESPNR